MKITVYMCKLNTHFLYLSYETDLISIGFRYNSKWYRGDYERLANYDTNGPALFNFGDEE
jgi:hypothetical protein